MSTGKIIVIVGIPGVGKTSVINYAVDKLAKEGYSSIVVNYGTVMLEEAMKKGLVNNRDEIRRLDVEKQMELQRMAAERINELSKKYDVLILDTHLFIKTKRGRWPGLNNNNLPYLPNIRQIILIEAEPEEIYSRRMRDQNRYRADYGGLNEIKEDLTYNRAFSASVSVLTNSPIYIINNKEGGLEAAGEELYNIIKEVISE
ncbi:adenylate kinase [Candidatus Geothermarchaeota archaeon]|nr:MAG: adenylate kinase [Candidatus Geothermarchaeota archaeon]HEW93130.1 adenylate kinase [Thermoprotei archaeon]